MVLASSGFAQDLTPPVVANPLPDLTITAGTTSSTVNLKKTFALSGVTGQVVRMATVLGDIDIEMLSAAAPNNVANFLSYVNSGAYNGSIINRSIPGFIIQGGGYYVAEESSIVMSPENAPVNGEPGVSNTRGTLALALSTGPDSGTNQWFFNLADNSATLDGTSDGGPFTVFGRVIEGDLATMDAVAALPTEDFSSSLGQAFANTPLYNYSASAGASVSNLVLISDVAIVPLVPATLGADSVLTLKVKNNNPGLVTATISGKKLKLAYAVGQTGTAVLKVVAHDSAGSSVKSKFTVTVQ